MIVPHAFEKRRLVFAILVWGVATSGFCETVSIAGERAMQRERSEPPGVCPPFHLLDEDGDVINPVTGENAEKPYSPKQTCGACHDYDKITQGYHFMQGKGEEPTADQKKRCLWARTPGNYGGTWCSPAPLYRYLSPKENESAATMDLTSFTFFTSPCGACHPGGGSAEFDRDGKRYDHWMADPKNDLSPGAENGLDGDYCKARWSETGVMEADCLLCHMPEYNLSERKKQLGAWNFRWAATAGAGFAKVTGSVSESRPVEVSYVKDWFNKDGTIEPHIVREPRNEVCLSCHSKPGWKKRGANFRGRTDVHLRAGLKCVDCHPAGTAAIDPRIAGREEHQFGKGDDPGGCVRDDLDNTCITCADCHDTGRRGAPIAKHRWLPPLHLDKIACQTCHIPERAVKAALAQAGDVFNPGTKIPTKGKHLWTFYGPDGDYWNHYGDLEMMGYDDKPTDAYQPALARYKGKIYPVNRIHSAWPAIEVEGETALMQPKMGDIYKMWTAHQSDSATYPDLSEITDDNGDGVPEVNRAKEIDALISAVTQLLADKKYPMEGKRVVWVMDDRVYSSGTDFRIVETHPWEASPYANVHKYNHDVLPANAAIGVNGCTDCHHPESPFFFAENVKYLFDENGEAVTEPQYRVMGLSPLAVTIGAWREAYLKPVTYGMIVVLVLTLVAAGGGMALAWVFEPRAVPFVLRMLPVVAAILGGIGALMLLGQPRLTAYMFPTRFQLDANHFPIAVAVLLGGLGGLLIEARRWCSPERPTNSQAGILAGGVLTLALVLAGAAGVIMFLKISTLESLTRYSYSVFDLAVALALLGTIFCVVRYVARICFRQGKSTRSIVPSQEKE